MDVDENSDYSFTVGYVSMGVTFFVINGYGYAIYTKISCTGQSNEKKLPVQLSVKYHINII